MKNRQRRKREWERGEKWSVRLPATSIHVTKHTNMTFVCIKFLCKIELCSFFARSNVALTRHFHIKWLLILEIEVDCVYIYISVCEFFFMLFFFLFNSVKMLSLFRCTYKQKKNEYKKKNSSARTIFRMRKTKTKWSTLYFSWFSTAGGTWGGQ